MSEYEVSRSTLEQLISKDTEERARAAIELLTRHEPKLIEQIVDHVRE